jgi:hypothetical protein
MEGPLSEYRTMAFNKGKLTARCDAFLSKRKRRPLLRLSCLLKIRSNPRAIKNEPDAAEATSWDYLRSVRWIFAIYKKRLTMDILCLKTIISPPRAPNSAITTQSTAYIDISKLERRRTTRTPNDMPPMIAKIVRDAVRKRARRPKPKRAAKKAKTMISRVRSATLFAAAVLTTADQAGEKQAQVERQYNSG